MATREEIMDIIEGSLDDILDPVQATAGTHFGERLAARIAVLDAEDPPLAAPDYVTQARFAVGTAVSEVFETNDWRTAFVGAIADGILANDTSLDPHAAVRVATTANITLSGIQTVDGILLVDGDRVLVKDQTDGTQNGVWIVHSGAWTRATDMDATGELVHGTFVAVLEGTEHQGQSWIVTTDGTIILGTTATTWELYQGSLTISAGDGLVRVGNTFNVGAGTGITVTADAVAISATYAGQTSIVTLGTVTSGVWHGSVMEPTYGGTGITVYSLGDMLYGSAPNTLSALPGNLTTTRKFLRQTGSGSASAAPVWDTLVDADLPATAVRTSTSILTTGPLTGGGTLAADRTLSISGLSGFGSANQIPGTNAGASAWEYKTLSGTTNRLTVTHSPGFVTWDISAAYAGQTSIITLGTVTTGVWHGTPIELVYGGTGLSSYVLGDMLYASNTTTLARLAGNTTTGRRFLGQTGTGAASAAPVWDTLINADIPTALSGKTYNGLTLTAAAVGFTIAGGTTSKTLTVSLDADVSGTNTGDQYTALAGLSVVGRAASSSGAGVAITATTASGAALRESGGVIGWGTLATAAYGTASVTYAKVQDVAGLSVFGRASSTSGVGADITAGTDGFVLRRSGTAIGFGTIGDASITSLAWSKLTGVPSTISGIGITDAVPTSRLISTTAPLAGGGALTADLTLSITTNGIGDTLLRQSAGLSVIGRTSSTLGNVADIVAGTDGFILRRSGTALAFGQIVAAGITDGTITLAKNAAIAAATILGNNTAGAVSPIALTASQARTVLGLGTADSPTFTGATVSGLTAGRVVYTGTGGVLQASASFTYNGTNLVVASDMATSLILVNGGTPMVQMAATGITHIQLNSAGTHYGTIQNDSGNTWSLGYKTVSGTSLGTVALTWNNAGAVTVAGAFSAQGGLVRTSGNGVSGTATNRGLLIIGNSSAAQIQVDTEEIQAMNNATPTDLYLNYRGGNTILNGAGTGSVAIGFESGPIGNLDVRTGSSLNVLAAFGGTTALNSVYPGYIYFSAINTINFGYSVNGTAEGWINYRGYQNGTTQFRDLNIADGKNTGYVYFKGSQRAVIINNGQLSDGVGNLQVNGKAGASYFYNNYQYTDATYNAEASGTAYFNGRNGATSLVELHPLYNYLVRPLALGDSITPSEVLHLYKPNAGNYVRIERSSNSYEAGIYIATAGASSAYIYMDNLSPSHLNFQMAGESDTAPRMRFRGDNSNIEIGLNGGNMYSYQPIWVQVGGFTLRVGESSAASIGFASDVAIDFAPNNSYTARFLNGCLSLGGNPLSASGVTPTSALYLQGALAGPYSRRITAGGIGIYDMFINIEASGVYTLPAANSCFGRVYFFTKQISTGTGTIAALGSDVIQFAGSTFASLGLAAAGSAIILVSNGSNKWIAFNYNN